MKTASVNSNPDTRSKLLDAAFFEVYKNGYHGAATAAILKAAEAPKGSMYHFFSSKKELVLQVVQERILPKMNAFFNFESVSGEGVLQSLERIFGKMQTHEMLIANGCPMHRLMVEMAPLDEDFARLLGGAYERFVAALSALLLSGVKRGELELFDTDAMARFIINATWGELSLPASLSSAQSFARHTAYLLSLLKSYKK